MALITYYRFAYEGEDYERWTIDDDEDEERLWLVLENMVVKQDTNRTIYASELWTTRYRPRSVQDDNIVVKLASHRFRTQQRKSHRS